MRLRRSSPEHPRRPRLLAGLAALAVIAVSCSQLETLSTEEALERMNVATTNVYAADGSLIASLHGEINREIVTLDTIPEHVQNAVLAIEDQRFWEHPGLDLRSIGRALVENLEGASDQERQIQGGSTLSQQLVKNLYFPEPSRTLDRKIAEARLTLQFEQQYEKDEILEMYLNTVYFGRGVYGIETAAQAYFDKNADDLTIAEAAFLAGLVHEPGRYEIREGDAPEHRDQRLERATARRDLVIGRMADLELITPEQETAARAETLELAPRIETRWRHPYFVDMLLRQLGVLGAGDRPLDQRFEFLGEDPNERSTNVYRGGLRIYTTLDPQVQQAAEEAIENVLPEHLDRLSAALTAIEPSTGFIRAVVGGRNYYPECDAIPDEELPHLCRIAKVNLALGDQGGGTGRQPGSAFKTFVAAAALERGVSIHSTYSGTQFTYTNPPAPAWNVRNYEGSGGGHMSVMEATVRSVNAAFARLLIDGVGEGDGVVGATRVAELARRMGIGWPTPEELREECGDNFGQTGRCTPPDHVPAIALGAKEVSPLDMASAYGTLAAEGVRVEPTAIVRITDNSGNTLYEAEPAQERVLPEGIARGMTHMLERVIQRGTGTRAQLGRPAAGKTGTSQAWRDAYFAGYVPQLAAAVWVGNPITVQRADGTWATESLTPANGYPFRVTGGSFPAMIWQYFMTRALEGVPVERFNPPPRELFVPQTTPAPMVDLPDVLGLPREDAVSALQSAGFAVSETSCLARDAVEGIVVRQTPGGGGEAAHGSTVEICLSVQTLPSRDAPEPDDPVQDDRDQPPTPRSPREPRQPGDRNGSEMREAAVPNVIGLSVARARSDLHQAGFQSAAVRECEPGGETGAGRVWRQNPQGGHTANTGATVTVWYSSAGC